QHPEHFVDGRIRLVGLVEKQETRDLLLLELAQNELELRHLLFVELAHYDCRADRRQRRAHVLDEFYRALTIDEGVIVVQETRSAERQLDAHLVIARFLAGVADGVAALDRALALDRAGAGEDRLEQRRLSALERAHQRDAPWARGACAVLCHVRLAVVRPSAIVSGRRGDWQEAQ